MDEILDFILRLATLLDILAMILVEMAVLLPISLARSHSRFSKPTYAILAFNFHQGLSARGRETSIVVEASLGILHPLLLPKVVFSILLLSSASIVAGPLFLIIFLLLLLLLLPDDGSRLP